MPGLAGQILDCRGMKIVTGRCLLRKRCGLLVFSLASALRCLSFKRRPCAGRHLLFFAAAKKSRQKKAANTANSCPCLRAPNRSHASHGGVSVQRMLPTLRMSASPTSSTRAWASGSEWFVPPRWQTVRRLSRRIAWRSYRVERVRYRSEVRRVEHKGPTHSLPPGRRWTIWQGMLKRGSAKRVRRTARALATNLNREVAARSKGPVGVPQAGTRIGGVSRFLLPTFLCGGKEK
ncbi:hypothetical protein SAMN05192544_10732 [Paraburkholderia hospita]|nr:hypothetical protein SAMN05192544_10732 [Paraburkholderia hospita]